MSVVRFVFEDPRVNLSEIPVRLRGVPATALVEALASEVRARHVDMRAAAPLRVALAVAVKKGREDRVAELAADPTVGWWARTAAACALVDERRLSPAHGADVFEAVAFGMLAGGDVDGAAEAVTAVLATTLDRPAAIRRIEGWRALCGVSGPRLWARAAERLRFEPAGGADPADEVRVRAWATPPDDVGDVVARFEIAPRGARNGFGTLVALWLNGDEGVRVDLCAALINEASMVHTRTQLVASGAIEVPPTELAALVSEALEMTPEDVRLDGARLVTRLVAGALPEVPAGPLPDADAAARLLAHRELGPTWGLDAADDPDAQARAVERALLAGRWCGWRGEPEAAGALAALARDASMAWGPSRLRAALLADADPLPPELAPGAPEALRLGRVPLAGMHDYAVRVVAAFKAWPEGTGADLPWARAAIEYGLSQTGVTPLLWTPWVLRDRILMQSFAEQATATGADAAALCAELRALLSFLGASWGLPQAARLAEGLDAGFEAMLREQLDDQHLWLPTKRVMLQARADGVLRDKEELQRRLAELPYTLGAPFFGFES